MTRYHEYIRNGSNVIRTRVIRTWGGERIVHPNQQASGPLGPRSSHRSRILRGPRNAVRTDGIVAAGGANRLAFRPSGEQVSPSRAIRRDLPNPVPSVHVRRCAYGAHRGVLYKRLNHRDTEAQRRANTGVDRNTLNGITEVTGTRGSPAIQPDFLSFSVPLCLCGEKNTSKIRLRANLAAVCRSG